MMAIRSLMVAVATSVQLMSSVDSLESCPSTRGNSLLQTQQVVGKMSVGDEVEGGIPAPQAAGWLGWGHHVAMEDLWLLQNIQGESLLKRDIPEDCFERHECPHTHFFDSEHFESVESWSEFYSSDFSLGGSSGFGGISLSIDSSLGYNSGSSGSRSKTLSYAVTDSARGCFRLVRDQHCAYNKSNLQPALLERVNALPKGHDAITLNAWVSAFVGRFGTHMTFGSTHGALVQSLTFADSQSGASHSCMDRSLCQKFGWVAPSASEFQDQASNVCVNASRCDNRTGSSASERSTCIAVGGDKNLSLKICQASVPQETMEAWLGGGDMNSGTSIIRYSFMPIATFLTNVDFEFREAADTLTKAIEFSECHLDGNPPLQQWTEEGTCECARNCQNGGTMDTSTCLCTCLGDENHGWQGPTCEETYGTCQPGRGTWNDEAAGRCSINNVCASWWSGSTCRPTDVCCASRTGTKCCDFGSTCHCGHSGCDCVRS